MQDTSSTMETALGAHDTTQSFNLVELLEIYAADYAIPTTGFDPADAEERFCGVEGFTFLGLAYGREYVDRGDASRFVGKKENSCACNFSNVSRVLAEYVLSTDVEGKLLVLRCVDSTSAVLEDSVVVFWGRLERPGDLGDTDASLTATQRYGQINLQFPRRTYGPNDPKGRAPNDPDFEGFRFTATAATVQWTTRERRQGWGSLLGLTKKVRHSQQASSHTDVSAERVVPDGFGRVQLYGDNLSSIDIGGAINVSIGVMEGVVAEFIAVTQTNPKFSQLIGLRKRYGYAANEGPTGREQVPVKQTNPTDNVPGDGYYSRTAWFHGYVTGSTPDVDEAEAPDFMILVLAKLVLQPDGSGDFTILDWTDNPAFIARHLFTSEDYFNEGEDSVDSASCVETAEECDEYVIDNSQGERFFIEDTDAGLVGDGITRLRSTSLTDPRSIRIGELGEVLAGLPEIAPEIPVDPEPFDPTDPPVNITPQTALRRRHTTNLTITEKVAGTDFLYGAFAETARLYFPRNAKGRIEIRREKAVDNTRLRVAAAPGDTTLKVLDVEPWKTGPRLLKQRLLTGAHQITSEVRNVVAAAYTSDGNAITITKSVSGTVTATLSGATFSGGSASVAASATVTIGGSPAAGDTITVTIGGVRVVYTLDSYDTTATVAAMLARTIHATPALRQFVKATWASGSSVVSLSARYGVLTLSSALANAHAAQVANPTAAPTPTAAAGGALPAGLVYLAYAYTNAVGETALSPVASVIVTANQKVSVATVTLPAGATGVNWYVGRYVDDSELLFHSANDGSSFFITDLPASTSQIPEESNTTGEELMRVAASYACNDQGAAALAQAGLTRGNIHNNMLKWPLGSQQTDVNQLKGTFFNAGDDYAPTPIEVNDYDHQTRTRKVNSQEVDLSGFDNYWAASAHLNFRLSKLRDGNLLMGWSTGPAGMLHEEGDVVVVSGDNGGFVNVPVRLEQVSVGPPPPKGHYTVKLVARKYSTLMFSDRVRRHSIKLPTTLRHVTPLATEIQLLDIPFFRERDAAAGSGILVTIRRAEGRGSWKGAAVWVDTGGGYEKKLDLDVEGVSGETLTALPDHAPGLDTTNTLRVRLDNAADVIATVTDDELRAGANLFRDGGEIFQARDVALVGGTDDEYDLSHLRRGLYGTENETAGHVIGDEFTVLDGRVFHLPIDAAFVGAEIKVKAVTVNQDLADAVEHTFTWLGYSQKPLAIARVELEDGEETAPRDAAGNIYLGVWPRSNLGYVGDRYRYTPLEDDGTEVAADAFEYFREGQPQPALLVSDVPGTSGKYNNLTATVSGNVFSFTGGGTGSGRARSSQKIRQEGNYAEATLRGAADCTVEFGLMAAGKDWRTAAFDYRFVLGSAGGGDSLEIYEGATLLYTEDASAYVATGKRFRVRLMGNKVQFFRDYVDDSTPVLAESVLAPNFPVRAVMGVSISGGAGAGYVENVTMTTNPLPGVIVTAAQQQEWYGSLKEPMRVRIEQDSGVREVGWGMPWEGEI